MDRILHDKGNSERLLQIVADTLILVRQDGVCVDVDIHSDLWFLQEERLLGKNLFELLPKCTYRKIFPDFQQVISNRKKCSANYQLELSKGTYYFKCIMSPYNGMVLCQYRDITERCNVKLQLEKVNNELKEIQKVAQIGQWKYNTYQNIICYVGYTGIFSSEKRQKISLKEYVKMVLEEDRQTLNYWLVKNRMQENDDSIDYRINYDGAIYYIRLKAYMREKQMNGSFNIEGYIQNITDIQRRRNDVNTLTYAINNAKESIFAAKEDGTLVFTNRQFRANHCIQDKMDTEQLKVYDIVGDLPTLESWHQRCKGVKPNESVNFIAYHPLKENPGTLAFEGTVYHVTSDEGETSYWSFSHDISDRLRYESQIKRLNRIMDTTMKNLPASIVVKDVNNDFRYIYRNRQVHNQTIETTNTVGKNDFDYYPQEVAQEKRLEDIHIVQTGEERHWIIEDLDEQGNLRILDKRKMKVESDSFSPIIISIEWNITQLELMKRELMVEKEKAENADQMKSAFLANMSHEIRTPLNAIVGFSRIIAESDNTEEREQYYEIVEANNERLLQLINEILDLSKIESGIVEFTYTPVRLHNLCREVYDAHVFRCPEGVKLISDPSDDLLVIDSDKNRVFQVFSNLIGNAFKFTTQGSVSYGYRQEGRFILFYVSDTGLGIEPSKVDKVFDRFVKVNNVAQGTGLGLSICKTIIERLGGKITVASELGKGTTFTFTLPARKVEGRPALAEQSGEENGMEVAEQLEKAGNSRTNPEKQAVKERKSITLLVAEDTDSNYDLLYAILGKMYHLERAKDGMEAVLFFEELKPDLILMDMKMPNLDGLEATKIIREISPRIPIIAQSAYAYEHDQQAAKDAGCNDFITKPIVAEVLKETVKKWLNAND